MNRHRTRRIQARILITLRQNRLALGFLGAWLSVSTLAFHFGAALDWPGAIVHALALAKLEGAAGAMYVGFTEVVVFGAIASVVIANVTRRYRPEATAAAIARASRGHVLVVGYSHLGERIRELAHGAGAEVVVVESDPALTLGLVRDEEAVVVGSTSDPSVLDDAAASRAAVVVIATDDLEEAAVACRGVRARNPRCELVVRCSDDDVGKALARAYGARAISTSRIAAAFVGARANKLGARRAIVVGENSLAARVTETFAARDIDVFRAADVAELERAPLREAEIVVFTDDDLGRALVCADRVRDVNPSVEIIARVFHEDAAQILSRAPFRCTLLSTSRLAAESLVSGGLLRRVAAEGPLEALGAT